MNIYFILRGQGKGDPKVILRIFDSRFHKRNFMLSTGRSIKSNLWDKRRNRAKSAVGQVNEDELLSLNRHLDHLEQHAITFLSERHNSSKLNREDLKAHLQNLKMDEQKALNESIEKETNFFNIWEHLITTTKNAQGKRITKGTIRSKKQTKDLLEEYCKSRKINLSFEKIDMNFYHDFDEYMIGKKLSDNTRGKHFKEIKAVIREANDRDIPVSNAYLKKRFKVIRTQPDNVYLNDAEIKQIFNKKLSGSQERVRDIFVMACYVGVRHSDWKQITKKNIVTVGEKEMLKIKQTKTGAIIHIPLHTAVRAILLKYNGVPPKVIANQKFNEALKVICEKAELGNVIIDNIEIEKWTEVTTHTARRSFATNAYLSRSMDVYQIMKCTGHKTESSFLRYLKLDGKDFAIQAADSKFFKDLSWTTLKVA